MSDRVKYLVFRGEIVPLFLRDDGLWYSIDGTIFAVTESSASKDKIARCGVGIFSLPPTHELTAYCAVHDFMSSSPAYQLFHKRSDADAELMRLIKFNKRWGWLARPFWVVTRLFGAFFWENKRTNV